MKTLPNLVRQLEKSQGSNGYLVPLDGGFALIDPGVKLSANAVLAEMAEAGMVGSLRAILLTHYDVDHAGAAAKISTVTGAPVWISAEDAAVLRRQRPAGTLFRKFLTFCIRVKLPADTHYYVPGEEPAPGITVIPSPGHTDGHVAFLWKTTLFCGDAVLLNEDGSFKQFAKFIISDTEAALASTTVLEELNAEWVLPGHGKPTHVTATQP